MPVWMLTACGTPTAQANVQVVKVYATTGAATWLQPVYQCAAPAVAVDLTDPQSADLTIRLGQPDALRTPAFQIGSDEIVVIVNPQNNISSLNPGQVRDLFSGRVASWKDLGGADLPVDIWSFNPDDDIQIQFNDISMLGQSISSRSHLAVSLQNMASSVANTPGSIGLLTKRAMVGNVQEAAGGVSIPVLAIPGAEPQGAVRDLIACLQK